VADKEAAETRRRGLEFVRCAAWPIMPGTRLPQDGTRVSILESEAEQLRFVTRYAHQPLHGYLSVGEALPWRDAWLTEAAQSLKMPVAILAGTEDVLYRGAEVLHQRLPQSHFVSIQDARTIQ